MRAVNTTPRTKLLGAVAGLLVGAVGVALVLAHAGQPLGTILIVAGLGFGGAMLASLWIFRHQD